MDVLADMLRHSLLAPEEMEKERRRHPGGTGDRRRLAAAVRRRPDRPDALAGPAAGSRRRGNAGDGVGDEPRHGPRVHHATVRRQQRRGEHRRRRHPRGGAGPCRPGDGRLAAGNTIGLVSGGGGQQEPRAAVGFKKTEQAHICPWLFPVCRLSTPTATVLDLLSVLLGEGMSSRLFLELRERLGLCYDIHSYVEPLPRYRLADASMPAVDPEERRQGADRR